MSGSGEGVSPTESILENPELTCPSTIEGVAIVENAAQRIAQRTGFDEDTASKIALAVREAAISAGKHGNLFSPGTAFTAALQRRAEGIVVCIAGRGAGLDVASLPDPLDPGNLFRESDRGVFLMRAIMGQVRFRQLQPGTEVTLTKFINRESGGHLETKIRHV